MAKDFYQKTYLAGFAEAIQQPESDIIRLDHEGHYLAPGQTAESVVLIKIIGPPLPFSVFAHCCAMPMVDAGLPFSYVFLSRPQDQMVCCGVRAEINERDFFSSPKAMLQIFENKIVPPALARIQQSRQMEETSMMAGIIRFAPSGPFVPGNNARALLELMQIELDAQRRPSLTLVAGRRGCGKKATVAWLLAELGYQAYQLALEGGKNCAEVLTTVREFFALMSGRKDVVFVFAATVADFMLGGSKLFWEGLIGFIKEECRLPIILLSDQEELEKWWGTSFYRFRPESHALMNQMVHAHFTGLTVPLQPDECTLLSNPENTLRYLAGKKASSPVNGPTACFMIHLLQAQETVGEDMPREWERQKTRACTCTHFQCWPSH